LVLGESHPKTLRYMAELGASYRNQGRFAKSVEVLKTVFRFQNPDGPRLDIIWRNEELGMALRGLGSYHEASVYLGKSFYEYLPLVGATDEDVKLSCWRVAECYIQLRDYYGALNLFRGYIEKVQVEGGKDHPFLREVEGWIRDLNNHLSANRIRSA